MASKIFQKLTFTTVGATLSLGFVIGAMFAKAISAATITQAFNGTLTLDEFFYYSGPQTTSYSGFVTYSEPNNGSSCGERTCVPIEIENWSFKLNEKELNSPGISSFSGSVAFESVSSSTPLSWSLHWLADPTGDTGNYGVNWQQGKGIDVNNVYFRGYFLYVDSNPQISHSRELEAIPEPSGTMGLLGGLAVLGLAGWIRKNTSFKPR